MSGAVGIALLGSLAAASSVQSPAVLGDFAQPALRDFSATAAIVQKDSEELRKIDDSFEKGYGFKESRIQYKEPLKLRVDSKRGFLSVRYVINGKKKATQVPGLRYNKVKDITGRPGEEQSMLDSGIITPGFLADAVSSRFIRYEKLEGRKVPVFEFWPTDEKGARHHFVWMDPDKHIVLRRDVHHRRGGLKMRFMYRQPQQVAGLWIPTRVEVYNAESRLAAVTQYTHLRVNSGLDDSLFRL
jgi:outer membrane lipoprotein-sorting protein